MDGYTDRGLILCPAYECYDNKVDMYYTMLKRSIDNIINLCTSKGVTPYMLTTDEVANCIHPAGVTWAQVLTPGDEFFAKKYCTNMDVPHANVVKYNDIYKEVLAKYPFDKTKTKELAFEDVLKRASKAEKLLIKRFKLIFNIQTPNNASYNIKPKDGSDIILVSIHNGTFLPKTYIGSMEVNPIELLNYDMANRPLYEWRF